MKVSRLMGCDDRHNFVSPADDRRVLMIAAAFPPTGGPGVQRSAKFAKYLPQFGWRPIVWTLRGMDGLPADLSLRAELPSEVTIHARPFRRGLVGILRRTLRRAGGGRSLSRRWAGRTRPDATRASTRLDGTGTSWATGRPRSVIVTSSPATASATTAEAFCFSARIPTSL